uniref:Uncharacterized protein n=1 Tax=Cacopsylla melanoneura TaxID=428564 RepID=A0A8D8ZEN6_9HEMI
MLLVRLEMLARIFHDSQQHLLVHYATQLFSDSFMNVSVNENRTKTNINDTLTHINRPISLTHAPMSMWRIVCQYKYLNKVNNLLITSSSQEQWGLCPLM